MEDDDALEEPVDPAEEDVEEAANDSGGAADGGEAAVAVSERSAVPRIDSPGIAAAAAASAALSNQQLADDTEEVDEEPHLHFRWRACWGTMEQGAIAAAA